MRPYIPAALFVGLCILASHQDVKADEKAEKEARCESACKTTAEANYKSCNHIPECESYVFSELNICMSRCGK